ncbi:sterol desaturase family protein [Mesorhizobium sp. M0142]|uniref:sterol desaturase family protein n=1 Tax=unclassified Mesorhizobium TaxID=325217 RepID=UPI00333807EE
MDDLKFGTRSKRGDWAPNELLEPAPIWLFPPNPKKLLKWLPSYFFPYNLLFMVSALAYWQLVVPDAAVLQNFAWGWSLKMLAVNLILAFLWYQSWELPLYVRRRQGNRFKYNHKFPADQQSNVFWFNKQTLDNMLRSLLIGVPIWTCLQVLMLWSSANGYIPWLNFSEHPVWLGVVAVVVPIIHDFHFYCIHRLIHVPVLYKYVHSVHHNSINPSPWSSLSMHPIEHLLYFGVVFWHFVIPSNPVIALYQLHFAGFGAVPGHIGFDTVETSDEQGFDTHAYMHYLHHKYFEVNYGGEGLVPVDRMFGTYHDGSKESDERMKARFRAKKERLKDKSA